MKAILFDFDGTLAIPTLDFSLMRQRVIESLLPFVPDIHRTTIPSMELIDSACAQLAPLVAGAARNAAMQAIEEVEIAAAAQSGLFPFVRPMFALLQEKEIAFGIVTRNCRAALQVTCPDIEEQCRCILTRDDVTRVKPEPEHLEKALDLLGVSPQNALMVGDHPMDITAGKRAGMKTAGVTSGDSDHKTLLRENPDYLAHDAGKLMAMLGIV